MSEPRTVDVIVPVDGDLRALADCVGRVLECSGPNLGRVLLITNGSRQLQLDAALKSLPSPDSRIRVVVSDPDRGWAGLCNLGLNQTPGDAVVLSSRLLVSYGWLSELHDAAHRDERVACASPWIGQEVSASRDERPDHGVVPEVNGALGENNLLRLPSWATIPRPHAMCTYFRHDLLGAAGPLEEEIDSPELVLDDWMIRAQGLGLVARRANRALVTRTCRYDETGPPSHSPAGPEDPGVGRDPLLMDQVVAFESTLDSRLESHAHRFLSSGKLRVALDIRHLPGEEIGTRTYARSLALGLAELPGMDLTLLIRYPAQAIGLKGRVVMEPDWLDDVAVIHKPAQVFDKQHLELLYRSTAHVLITYQDLIAFRVASVFSPVSLFHEYRATSRLSLPAAQRVLAYSQSVAREIELEFGIPPEDIDVIPLGVDAPAFARIAPGDADLRQELGLPGRYFFSLATNYPHKNLGALLEAYALFRARYRGIDPPGLVLAGYSMARGTAGSRREQRPLDGVISLGPVSFDQLRVLYQHAAAFVFPSLYEGFGLPPLEAMAARTPVIAMPFSSVPEVCADCVLYPEGLSPADLARAMIRLEGEEELRSKLCDRGLRRAEELTWERTALATFEAYRSAVLRPSDRSLRARSLLRDAIVHWSLPCQETSPPAAPHQDEPPLTVEVAPQPVQPGIINACNALNAALRTRLRREARRLPAVVRR